MSTQNVLDAMTAGISDRKNARAAALTPVGTEKNGPLDGRHDAPFPFDGADTVRGAIREGMKHLEEIVAELGHVREGLLALEALYGKDTESGPAAVARVTEETKQAEREADDAARKRHEKEEHERFVREFEAKSLRMANDAYAAHDVTPPAQTTDWACPVHRADNLVVLTARKSHRTYAACRVEGCGAFEKGA